MKKKLLFIINNLKNSFRKYFDFKSRASRSEFWIFTIFFTIISLIPLLIFYVIEMNYIDQGKSLLIDFDLFTTKAANESWSESETIKQFELIWGKKFDLYSDSDKILNLKKDNLSNINSFINNNFNKIKNFEIIVLENNYFKKHSLLPYSELPSIFDPFEKNILNEINLIKNIIKLIIKNSSNFDFREMFWLYSGLELYYLEKYIDEYHIIFIAYV